VLTPAEDEREEDGPARDEDGPPGAGNGGVDVATLGEPAEEQDGDGAGGDGNGGTVGALAEEPSRPARPRRAGAQPEVRERRSLWGRALAFLRASWAELQRMQWPDRRQTSQATAVVLGFVVIAGIYLGVADWIAQKIVNLII
jgi:preprotein translocase SecE subunit